MSLYSAGNQQQCFSLTSNQHQLTNNTFLSQQIITSHQLQPAEQSGKWVHMNVIGFYGVVLSVAGDVPVDSEVPVVMFLAQSSKMLVEVRFAYVCS